jgi:hypothetical protein
MRSAPPIFCMRCSFRRRAEFRRRRPSDAIAGRRLLLRLAARGRRMRRGIPHQAAMSMLPHPPPQQAPIPRTASKVVARGLHSQIIEINGPPSRPNRPPYRQFVNRQHRQKGAKNRRRPRPGKSIDHNRERGARPPSPASGIAPPCGAPTAVPAIKDHHPSRRAGPHQGAIPLAPHPPAARREGRVAGRGPATAAQIWRRSG